MNKDDYVRSAKENLLNAIAMMAPCICVHMGPDGDVVYAVPDAQTAIGYAFAPDPGQRVLLSSLPVSELAAIVDFGMPTPLDQMNAQVIDWGFGHQIV